MHQVSICRLKHSWTQTHWKHPLLCSCCKMAPPFGDQVPLKFHAAGLAPPVPCCIANWGEENRLHWHGLGGISTTLLQGSLWTLMLSPANNPIFQKEAENQDQVTDLGENTSSVHLSSDTRKLVLDGEHCNSLWKMKRD